MACYIAITVQRFTIGEALQGIQLHNCIPAVLPLMVHNM